MTRVSVRQWLWSWRSIIILWVTPLLLMPLPLVVGTKEAKCAFVMLLMAVYWVTESLTVGNTAMIPVALYPLFEIMPSKEVSECYMNNVSMLFVGGMCLAIALEYWNLHKRIALRVMMFVGSEPKWLMLGMMLATWFLSMWISNTGTSTMMVPIVRAILQQMRKGKKSSHHMEMAVDHSEVEGKTNGTLHNGTALASKVNHEPVAMWKEQEDTSFSNGKSEPPTPDINGLTNGLESDGLLQISKTKSPEVTKSKKDDEDHADTDSLDLTDPDDVLFAQMERGMLLSICYAANTGGMASLTGTGPNLVLKAAVDDLYEDYGLDSPVTFGTWMALGLPLSAMVLILCWLWLQAAFLRCRGSCNVCKEGSEESKRVHEVIAEEYRKMGPVSCSQKIIISLFVILVTLWITRDLGGVVGWAKTYPSKFINSSCPAMCIALLLFAIPRSLPKPAREGEGVKKAMPLMEWPYIQKRLPWHLVFLIGGGFALSKGSKRSGLSAMLGKQLDVFGGIDKWGVLFFISYATSLLTEVTSNSAICNLVLPILTELALRTGVHPLYYMITAALSCSFAYMLPVATAPNAIVYGTGKIRMTLMIKIGVVMNIVAVPLLIVMTGTLGDAIFDFDNVPAAFLNSTAAASP